MRRFGVCSIAFFIVVFFHRVPAFCQNTGAGDSHKSASNTSMVFISDTQSPLKVETLWLQYTDNDNDPSVNTIIVATHHPPYNFLVAVDKK
jgi:hypothetical protein